MRARALIVAATVLVGAALAGCTWPRPADPLDPGRGSGSGVGRPVLSFRWKKVVHVRGGDTRPQEFAGAVLQERPDGDRVYVGSLGGSFYALDAASGAVIWEQRIGAVSAKPLVDRGRVFLGTDDGAMLCLDTWNGSKKWKHATRGAVLEPPVAWGELIVFANDADRVVAVDRETGEQQWSYQRETPDEFTVRGHGGVTVVGDVVYAGFADGTLAALTAASGDVRWTRSLAADQTQFIDVDTTPVVVDGVLYAASSSGGLYALDAADGTEKWRLDIAGASEVAVDDGRVYVAAADAGLYALDLAGHVLWRQGLMRAGDPAAPQVVGDYLLVSTSGAGLFVVEKRSGRLMQSFNPGFGITAAPTVVGDRMWVLSNGGVLYAMGVERY